MAQISIGQRDLPSNEAVAYCIVTEVAALEDAEPTDLTPLASVVDVDALEALVGDHANFRGRISFSYLTYEVTIHSEESVTVSVEPA